MTDRERLERGLAAWSRDCPHCRERIEAGDPADWFGLLRHLSIPVELLEEVSAGVARQIVRSEPSRLAAPRTLGWLPRPMAWAAALVGAALVSVVLYRLSGPLEQVREPGVSAPPSAEEPARARVEVLSPAGAEPVVDLTVGDTHLVMVFSEEIEL